MKLVKLQGYILKGNGKQDTERICSESQQDPQTDGPWPVPRLVHLQLRHDRPLIFQQQDPEKCQKPDPQKCHIDQTEAKRRGDLPVRDQLSHIL